MYRPFFRQKEFLTDSLRLLSSRAGKLLSSKLIISPWPRAPDLALLPVAGGGERGRLPPGLLDPLTPPPGRAPLFLPELAKRLRWRPGAQRSLPEQVHCQDSHLPTPVPAKRETRASPVERAGSVPAHSPESAFLAYFLL